MLKLFPSTRQKYLNYREDVQHYYEVILIETELPDKALNIEIQSTSRYEYHYFHLGIISSNFLLIRIHL